MIGHSLRQALTETGLSVDWVRDGVLAESALAQGSYAAVLLDLGLPRRSGLEVLRRARQEGNRTPMLVLTARDGLDDRVSGLDLGADDYLVKPFELRELLARMRAIIRRAGGHAQSTIGTPQTQLDLATRQLVHEGTTVDSVGARVSLDARAARAARRNRVAHAARRAHLRLGRGSHQQRRRSVDSRRASQSRRRSHPQRARSGLARRTEASREVAAQASAAVAGAACSSRLR